MSDTPPIDIATTDNVSLNRILHKQHLDLRDVSVVLNEGSIYINVRGKIAPTSSPPDDTYREDNEQQRWTIVPKSGQLSVVTFTTSDIAASLVIEDTYSIILGTQSMGMEISRKLKQDGHLKDFEKN